MQLELIVIEILCRHKGLRGIWTGSLPERRRRGKARFPAGIRIGHWHGWAATVCQSTSIPKPGRSLMAIEGPRISSGSLTTEMA
jgi:hypothetical protein